MHLNPQEVLDKVTCRYIVIKKSERYPEYNPGDDVDIFCEDKYQMCRELLHLLSSYYSIKCTENEGHIHVDVLEDDLLVRFDVIDRLDGEMVLQGNEYALLAVRLLEYARYPKKKKHLKFVKDVLYD